MFKTPTSKEVLQAAEQIIDDGPGGFEVSDLTLLVMDHPLFKETVNRIASMPPDGSEGLRALITGALVTGLNFGVRIGEARQVKTPQPPPTALAEMNLWAWVGEDELGSGEIGLKQAQVPAGLIPVVATRRQKVEKFYPLLEAQAKRYRKRIRLCRFQYCETVRETEHGE